MIFSNEAYLILLCLTTSIIIDIGATQLKNTTYTISNFWSGVQFPPIEFLGLTSLTAPSTPPTTLRSFVWPKVLRAPDYQKCYFQQDGASPHKAALVQTWLTDRFGEKFIAKNEWPPRSPDLNPCDYFLCDYLKQRVYNPLPKELEDLRSNLTREIENIPAQML
jgi:hypothetical protein